MYEIKTGPTPAGVKVVGSYPFDQMEVGQWFFAAGKKSSTVRAGVFSYRAGKERVNWEKRFSCVTATVDGVAGCVCTRVK